MKEYLKVKIKSLAAETKIIREEENKFIPRNWNAKKQFKFTEKMFWLHEELDYPDPTVNPLYTGFVSHRMGVVRPEARATHIAYAYLNRKHLNRLEVYPDNIPDYILRKACKMTVKYDPNKDNYVKKIENFVNWVNKYRDNKYIQPVNQV